MRLMYLIKLKVEVNKKMLKEININNYKWQTDELKLKVLEAIERQSKIYGKVVVKEKVIAKGKYIIIYAYDKSLYRNIIVDAIQIS